MKICENCHGRKTQQYQRIYPVQIGDTRSHITHHSMPCPRCKGSGIDPIKAYCECNECATQVVATVSTEHNSLIIDGLNIEYEALIARCTRCRNPACLGGTEESVEISNAEIKTAHEAYLKAKEAAQ